MNKKKLKLCFILFSITTNLFSSQNKPTFHFIDLYETDCATNLNYLAEGIEGNHNLQYFSITNNFYDFNEDQNNQWEENNINQIEESQAQSSTQPIKKNYETYMEKIKNNQEKIGFAKLHNVSTLKKILNEEGKDFQKFMYKEVMQEKNESILELKKYDSEFFNGYNSITIYSHIIEKDVIIFYIKGKLDENKLFLELKNKVFGPSKGTYHPFYCLSRNGEDLEKAKNDLVEAIKMALKNPIQEDIDNHFSEINNGINIHKRKNSISHEDISKENSKRIKTKNKEKADYFTKIKEKQKEIGFAKLHSASTLKKILNEEGKYFQKFMYRKLVNDESKSILELKTHDSNFFNEYDPIIIYSRKIEENLMILYIQGKLSNKLFLDLKNKAFSGFQGNCLPFYCLSKNGKDLKEAENDLVKAIKMVLSSSAPQDALQNWMEKINNNKDKIELGKFYTLPELEDMLNYEYAKLCVFFSKKPSFKIKSSGNLPQSVHYLKLKSDREEDLQKTDLFIFAMYGQSKPSTLVNALKLKKDFNFLNGNLALYYFSAKKSLLEAKKDLIDTIRKSGIDVQEDQEIQVENNTINNSIIININNFIHVQNTYIPHHNSSINANLSSYPLYESPSFQENNTNQPTNEFNLSSDDMIIDEDRFFDEFFTSDPNESDDHEIKKNDDNSDHFFLEDYAKDIENKTNQVIASKPFNNNQVLEGNISFDGFFVNDSNKSDGHQNNNVSTNSNSLSFDNIFF